MPGNQRRSAFHWNDKNPGIKSFSTRKRENAVNKLSDDNERVAKYIIALLVIIWRCNLHWGTALVGNLCLIRRNLFLLRLCLRVSQLPFSGREHRAGVTEIQFSAAKS